MDDTTSGPSRRADAPDTLVIDGLVDHPREAPRAAGPLADLLAAAGPAGDHGTVHSGDGLFQASIPLGVLAAASIGDDGRLAIDDAPTRCWLVKDVRRIEITDGRRPDSLPAEERAKT
jgi:hypothetical protein